MNVELLKIGDTVTNANWDDTFEPFTVTSINGNSYCWIVGLSSRERTKNINGFPQFLKLIDCGNRPFKRLNREMLNRMLRNSKTRVDALREITVRRNVRE